MSDFIEIEVDEGDGIDEPVALRFKQVAPPVSLQRVQLTDARGVRWWRVSAPGEPHALSAVVEDSSDGQARLVFGGLRGLLLTDETSAQERREPYLLLAHDTLFV